MTCEVQQENIELKKRIETLEKDNAELRQALKEVLAGLKDNP